MTKPSKAVVKQAKIAGRREVVGYGDLVGGIAAMLETARRASARAVNAIMTGTYWEIGRRIVEYVREAGSARNMERPCWCGFPAT